MRPLDDALALRAFGALHGLVVAAGTQRPHLETIAARRVVLAAMVCDRRELATDERSNVLIAALTADVGAALGRLSAGEGAQSTAKVLIELGHHEAAGSVAARFERPDGQGFPTGQGGQNIPLGGRIVAITDLLVRTPATHRIEWERRIQEMKDVAGSAVDFDLSDLLYALLQDPLSRATVERATISDAIDLLGATRGRVSALETIQSVMHDPIDVDRIAGVLLDAVSPGVGAGAGIHRCTATSLQPVASRGRVPDDLQVLPNGQRDGSARLSTSTPGTLVAVPVVTDNGIWGFVWHHAPPAGAAGDPTDELSDVATILAGRLAARAKAERLESRAFCDHLTGLSNRWLLEEELGRLYAEPYDHRVDAGLIMCDVDGLKAVNDSLGHQAGDTVLREVAAAITMATAGMDAVTCRLGGDEFCVLLRSGAILGAADLARRIEQLVGSTALGRVGLSCGIAYAAQADTPALLLSEADHEQYFVKRQRPTARRLAIHVGDRRRRR